MNPQSLPYREGNNIVIYDAKLINQSLVGARSTRPQNNEFYSSFLKGASYMCILLSFVGILITASPVIFAQVQSVINKDKFTKTQVILNPVIYDQKDNILNTEQIKLSFLAKYNLPPNLDWNFSIIIPKISLNSKVIPNVDPANKEEYMAALKEGVAHARFTALPSEEGIVYIFGHSTDYPWNVQTYNALFYSIKDLTENDEIIVLYNNKPYVYKTLYQKIIDQDNLVYLNSQTNAKMLVLQTCYPPGTTWKRLIVVASLVEDNTP